MRYLLLALFLITAAPLQAQQAAGTHIGIGVRVNGLLGGVIVSDAFESGLVGGGTNLLVPININGTFKIEPEIGYGRTSSGDEGFDSSASQFTIGIGVLPMRSRDDFVLYGGGRVRYTKITQKLEIDGPFGGGFETSASSVGIAPVVGGEYFFARWFSLGAEAGIEYRTFSFEEDEDEVESGDLSSISTLGSVIARFYFN